MKKLNHATKYTIMICIGLVIFNIVFGYVFTTEAAKAMRTQIDERMLEFNRADNAMYADKRAFYQTHEDRRKKRT